MALLNAKTVKHTEANKARMTISEKKMVDSVFMKGRWRDSTQPASNVASIVQQDEGPSPLHSFEAEGSSAYAVKSGALTVAIKGQSVVRAGTLTYRFANRDGVWKIEAHAWARSA